MLHRVLFIAAVFLSVTSQSSAGDFALQDGTDVTFASVEKGQAILRQQDRFLRAMSAFDRQARLKTSKAVSQEQYLDLLSENVVAWSDEERQRVLEMFESVRNRIQDLALPLPKTVFLVKVTGKVEANAAYCRKDTIVLPTSYVQKAGARLERVLIHELFHVLSATDAATRKKLYEIIGFHVCPPIPVPESLRDRVITNPDGPVLDSYVTLDLDGKPTDVVPFLFSRAAKYDDKKGGSFFDYLQFRLLVLERDDKGKHKAVLKDGEVQMVSPQSDAYFAKIGRNTNYIIHPDEVLADNFVHLVMKSKQLRTPEIVTQMGEVLAKKSTN